MGSVIARVEQVDFEERSAFVVAEVQRISREQFPLNAGYDNRLMGEWRKHSVEEALLATEVEFPTTC